MQGCEKGRRAYSLVATWIMPQERMPAAMRWLTLSCMLISACSSIPPAKPAGVKAPEGTTAVVIEAEKAPKTTVAVENKPASVVVAPLSEEPSPGNTIKTGKVKAAVAEKKGRNNVKGRQPSSKAMGRKSSDGAGAHATQAPVTEKPVTAQHSILTPLIDTKPPLQATKQNTSELTNSDKITPSPVIMTGQIKQPNGDVAFDSGREGAVKDNQELVAINPGRKPRYALKNTRISVGDSAIEMVRLPSGRFHMGSDSGDYDAGPLHEVSLPGFSIGKYEVTQRQWERVMGSNPSYFSGCSRCPVDSVSWEDIQSFIAKLSQMTGKKFRLPSEAEWEYACRGGGNSDYCGQGEALRHGWFSENGVSAPQPVGQREPNDFGLYDMSGNAYEWVADCWHENYLDAPAIGSAWEGEGCGRRVLRGGSWYYSKVYARSHYRNANISNSRVFIYGFRLAMDE